MAHGVCSYLSVKLSTCSLNSVDLFVNDCEPAEFGRGKVKVLEKDYRNTGQMDTVNFGSNFTPYEYGVVDKIVQALVYGEEIQTKYRGFRAQLHKLNVCTLHTICVTD